VTGSQPTAGPRHHRDFFPVMAGNLLFPDVNVLIMESKVVKVVSKM
jgi:hypothetical protein